MVFVGLFGDWLGLFGTTSPGTLLGFSVISPGPFIVLIVMTLAGASSLSAVIVSLRGPSEGTASFQKLWFWHTTTSCCLWTSVTVWLGHSPSFMAIESYGFGCAFIGALLATAATCTTREGCCGCCHCGADTCCDMMSKARTKFEHASVELRSPGVVTKINEMPAPVSSQVDESSRNLVSLVVT